MSERKHIACFFTAGYTELDELKGFINKINNQLDLIQLCPIKQKRNRKSIVNRRSEMSPDNSGMTGNALIEHVLKFIQTDRFREEEYNAIIIEDDKDDRFLTKDKNEEWNIDTDEWNEFKKDIIDKIHAFYPEMNVVFLMAAPEIEAWFIADYANGFGKLCMDRIPHELRYYFSYVLRLYISNNILTDKYFHEVEKYGYFDDRYRKLSEEIQKIFSSEEFVEKFRRYPDMDWSSIRYSKKMDGPDLLKNIDPEKVLSECTDFFREGYWQISKL